MRSMVESENYNYRHGKFLCQSCLHTVWISLALYNHTNKDFTQTHSWVLISLGGIQTWLNIENSSTHRDVNKR